VDRINKRILPPLDAAKRNVPKKDEKGGQP